MTSHDKSNRSVMMLPSILDQVQPNDVTIGSPRQQSNDHVGNKLFAEESSTDKQFVGNKNESIRKADCFKQITTYFKRFGRIPQKIIKRKKKVTNITPFASNQYQGSSRIKRTKVINKVKQFQMKIC